MKLKLLIFVSIFALASCKKDKTVTEPAKNYNEENPFDTFVAQSGFSVSAPVTSGNIVESGLAFSPNVTGKMKAITVKIPNINSKLLITIWDYDTQNVIRSETINVSAANTLTTKTISDFVLQKDKKYVISMNSNDYYHRNKPDNSSPVYPITAGNIKILEYRETTTLTQKFPASKYTSYFNGDLSFIFQQTE
jgi:hypothetical protein